MHHSIPISFLYPFIFPSLLSINPTFCSHLLLFLITERACFTAASSWSIFCTWAPTAFRYSLLEVLKLLWKKLWSKWKFPRIYEHEQIPQSNQSIGREKISETPTPALHPLLPNLFWDSHIQINLCWEGKLKVQMQKEDSTSTTALFANINAFNW